jgi:pimeloyl-ACP methyl ester carboxylesterase
MTGNARSQNYEFVLRGEIGDHFGLVFDGLRLERRQGNTTLTGSVLDQAQLHGVIERIQGLGIELVAVNPLDEPVTDSTTREEPVMSTAARPDTIVLVHGFWVTPRSWEHWIERYETQGYRVLAPAYPGFEVEVEALNEDPTPVEDLRVPAIVEKFEGVIGELDSPPILIGHSAGGAFTQILLDHGFGAAGVAINSAPTEGVRVVPLSQAKSTFPVLKNPANHHKAVGYTFEEWHYAFTNGFPEEQARELYERYHVPASGRILWDSVTANFKPGMQDTWVDYKNDDRAPLLFISGSEDHLMPPAIQQSNAKHYKSDTITEVKEFEGPHLLPAQDGWEEVADYALSWAVEHAAPVRV